jgi:hypothetical protein
MNHEEMIVAIANRTHEKFLEIYNRVNNGTRVKTTTDEDWTRQHGTDQADLAKLTYFELPKDWQFERWSGAKMAFDTLLQWVQAGKPLDDAFIEYASDFIHNEWLERNQSRAQEEHKLSYNQLSEEAKEKDRLFARSAVEIFENNK